MAEPMWVPTSMSQGLWVDKPRSAPLIPNDALERVLAGALNDSVTAQFLKQTGQWTPMVYTPLPWYQRVWQRIDRYLPRMSVHIGPRPECDCDD